MLLTLTALILILIGFALSIYVVIFNLKNRKIEEKNTEEKIRFYKKECSISVTIVFLAIIAAILMSSFSCAITLMIEVWIINAIINGIKWYKIM